MPDNCAKIDVPAGRVLPEPSVPETASPICNEPVRIADTLSVVGLFTGSGIEAVNVPPIEAVMLPGVA